MPYKNKEDRLECYKRYQQTQKYKEYDWKRAGIKLLGTEYTRYINASICEICSVELVLGNKSKNRKVIDHDHLSGYTRNICCNTCNVFRRKIDTKKLILHLELYRYFNRK